MLPLREYSCQVLLCISAKKIPCILLSAPVCVDVSSCSRLREGVLLNIVLFEPCSLPHVWKNQSVDRRASVDSTASSTSMNLFSKL